MVRVSLTAPPPRLHLHTGFTYFMQARALMTPVHVGLHLGALVASLQLCAGATGADGGGGLFIGYQGSCASGCVSNTSTTMTRVDVRENIAG